MARSNALNVSLDLADAPVAPRIVGSAAIAPTARRDARAAAAEPLAGVRRIELDLTRGLLVLLMISSHAVTRMAPAAHSFFQSQWWLPRGWGTTGFPMLTGFTVAVVCAIDRRRVHGLRKRAFRLLLVMFVSNFVFLAASEVLQGHFRSLLDAGWWVAVLTFRAESISAYMVPSILGLVAVPWLVSMESIVPRSWIAAGIAVCFLGAWWMHGAGSAIHDHRLLSMLFVTGLGGVPVLPLLCNALVGFLLGTLWHRHRALLANQRRLANWLALVSLVGMTSLVPREALAEATIAPVLHFLIVLVLGLILASASEQPMVRLLARAGQYSLLAFLIHRVLLHTTGMVLDHFAVSPTGGYMLLAIVNLVGVSSCCALRRRSARIDNLCRAIYL